jgi:hypothetical protein
MAVSYVLTRFQFPLVWSDHITATIAWERKFIHQKLSKIKHLFHPRLIINVIYCKEGHDRIKIYTYVIGFGKLWHDEYQDLHIDNFVEYAEFFANPSIQWVHSFFSRIKRPRYGVSHSPSFNAEVKGWLVQYLSCPICLLGRAGKKLILC